MHIRLIVHDVRSCHNVGSLLRTADAMGVEHVYLSGYTPYPEQPNDLRLPHIRRKLHDQIRKTALGAEASVPWSQHNDIAEVLSLLKTESFAMVALEQDERSEPLNQYHFAANTALLVGREVEGIEANLLDAANAIVEIPMLGAKESLNVVQATAMALYQCRVMHDSAV